MRYAMIAMVWANYKKDAERKAQKAEEDRVIAVAESRVQDGKTAESVGQARREQMAVAA